MSYFSSRARTIPSFSDHIALHPAHCDDYCHRPSQVERMGFLQGVLFLAIDKHNSETSAIGSPD